MSDNSDIILKFSDLWQEAIIGHCFKTYYFLMRCTSQLRPEWFQDPTVSTIAKQLFSAFDGLKEKRLLTIGEIEGFFAIKYPDPAEVRKYSNRMVKCVASADHVGLDILSVELTDWIKLLKMKLSLEEAASKFNNGKYDQVPEWIKSKMQEVQQASFIPDDSVQFADPIGFVKVKQEAEVDCLTTGHPDFDEILFDGAKIPPSSTTDMNDLSTLTTGGLAKGNTTVLMGPSNSGKTTTLTTMIAANIGMRKKVLYIPLEQQPEELQTKLYACLAGLTPREMSFIEVNETYRSQMFGAAWFLNEYLTMIPYLKPGNMFVEQVISMINLKQEEMKAATGFGYDMLVVDYPKKLRSDAFKFKTSSEHAEVTYVYQQFMDWASANRVHAVLPVQTNREGFKVNRGDQNRLLDSADIAGAYDIITNADNVITINRGPSDIAESRIKFHVAKCRRHEQGWTFLSKTDMGRSKTHGVMLSSVVWAPGAEDAITEDMLSQQLNDRHRQLVQAGIAIDESPVIIEKS